MRKLNDNNLSPVNFVVCNQIMMNFPVVVHKYPDSAYGVIVYSFPTYLLGMPFCNDNDPCCGTQSVPECVPNEDVGNEKKTKTLGTRKNPNYKDCI
jgi:hypothetical protein